MRTLMIGLLVLAMGTVAYAELQNVEVGGSIRIRGSWYEGTDPDLTDIFWWNRHPGTYVQDTSFVEQRTRVNVKADFTDNVSAFIELDSWDVWGEDFRSNYVTGADARGVSNDDVEVYQAYIEANEMFGYPLRLRVGRQELSLGSEWLVGVNDNSSLFRGLSFDAVTLNYATDMASVTAIWAKLAETFSDFSDDDADLYALYGSYLGLEDIVIDAYWMFVRDEVAVIGTQADLHTIGLRGAGTYGAFDFEAEVAYQFGEVEFPDTGWWFWRQDNDVDFSEWGGNLEVGYTFDMNYQPRVYLGFAYLGGGDLTDNTFWPWDEPDLEMPFNRLFSNWEYSEFLANTDLSNVLIYRLGGSMMPTESIALGLDLSYFDVDEEAPDWGWWPFRQNADGNLGIETNLHAEYHYSEDLAFRVGWAHFFSDDGVEDWNRWPDNALTAVSAYDDDMDYLYWETQIAF